MGNGDEGVYCVVCIVWSGLVRYCAVLRAETRWPRVGREAAEMRGA